MCSWENLLIQNSVQEIDGGGPGVMDLTVFGERERVFAVVCVISPRLSDSLRRAKQNKIIFVWFHSSQRRRTEKKKSNLPLIFIFLCLSPFLATLPTSQTHTSTNRRHGAAGFSDNQCISQPFVRRRWIPHTRDFDQCQRHVNRSGHSLCQLTSLYPLSISHPFRSYSLPLNHPRAILTLLLLPHLPLSFYASNHVGDVCLCCWRIHQAAT